MPRLCSALIAITRFEAQRIELRRKCLMFFNVDLVDDQDHRLLRFAQETREFLIDRRQAFLGVDDEKEKITLAQRFLGGAANLPGQFRFTRAKNPPGIPKYKGRRHSRKPRKSVARNPGLIVDDGNFAPNQTIK